jgi:hypothetical protein
MRRAVLVGVVALALVPGASGIESTIHPGVGIGQVKLGMTQAQVQKALGKWRFVNEQDGRHLSVGWGFGEWTVDFVGGRTVQVATTLVAQKTPTRVGPGSTWRALVRAYPHGVCTFNNDQWGRAEFLVPHKGGTQTIYIVRQPRYRVGQPVPSAWRVSEVHVRTPWVRLPEFAPNWTANCGRDWRTSDHP